MNIRPLVIAYVIAAAFASRARRPSARANAASAPLHIQYAVDSVLVQLLADLHSIDPAALDWLAEPPGNALRNRLKHECATHAASLRAAHWRVWDQRMLHGRLVFHMARLAAEQDESCRGAVAKIGRALDAARSSAWEWAEHEDNKKIDMFEAIMRRAGVTARADVAAVLRLCLPHGPHRVRAHIRKALSDEEAWFSALMREVLSTARRQESFVARLERAILELEKRSAAVHHALVFHQVVERRPAARNRGSEQYAQSDMATAFTLPESHRLAMRTLSCPNLGKSTQGRRPWPPRPGSLRYAKMVRHMQALIISTAELLGEGMVRFGNISRLDFKACRAMVRRRVLQHILDNEDVIARLCNVYKSSYLAKQGTSQLDQAFCRDSCCVPPTGPPSGCPEWVLPQDWRFIQWAQEKPNVQTLETSSAVEPGSTQKASKIKGLSLRHTHSSSSFGQTSSLAKGKKQLWTLKPDLAKHVSFGRLTMQSPDSRRPTHTASSPELIHKTMPISIPLSPQQPVQIPSTPPKESVDDQHMHLANLTLQQEDLSNLPSAIDIYKKLHTLAQEHTHCVEVVYQAVLQLRNWWQVFLVAAVENRTQDPNAESYKTSIEQAISLAQSKVARAHEAYKAERNMHAELPEGLISNKLPAAVQAFMRAETLHADAMKLVTSINAEVVQQEFALKNFIEQDRKRMATVSVVYYNNYLLKLNNRFADMLAALKDWQTKSANWHNAIQALSGL